MEKQLVPTGRRVYRGNHSIDYEAFLAEPRLIEVGPLEWQKHLSESERRRLNKEGKKHRKKEEAKQDSEATKANMAKKEAPATSPEAIAARIAGDRTKAQESILADAKQMFDQEPQAEDVAARIERERRERQVALLNLAKQQHRLAQNNG